MSVVLERPRLNKNLPLEEKRGKIAPPPEFTDLFMSTSDLQRELMVRYDYIISPPEMAKLQYRPDCPPNFRVGNTNVFVRVPTLAFFEAKFAKRRKRA